MKKELTKTYFNILVILLVPFLFSHCKQKDTELKTTKKWENFNVDNKISENEIFKKLDNEKEIFSALEKDTLMKKSSAVSYINNRNEDYDMKYSNFNNCRSYFWKKDTLSINIGIGNGFGGHGFIILVKNGKFYTEPYYSTDVVTEGEKESVYKIIYQKLTLNHSNFKIGDSIYGKIDFKSIETDNQNKTINHTGVGYFRTKVKEL
ncbi:hypothetical protein [Flavobacterium solisilvae]|uniref:Lipoprotein n=1 Tax=Flavobacterium solisilvae TaxID=1852019 RepID=A0ABX1QT24_9FLAO|nr:hypothetical protein [Flavobacterium solisilvae]NMH25372.1 hypothetical protein [Flavobacterium solisilvae]